MANPIQALNENFVYNSMLARALVQLLPSHDRTRFRLWLDKLLQMTATSEQMSIRNDYMWFMLLVLQANKRVTMPFKNPPPKGDLAPLKQILPASVYEEILTATDQNMSWLEKTKTESSKHLKTLPVASSPPFQFLENQPTPRNGIICYFAAFSDHDF